MARKSTLKQAEEKRQEAEHKVAVLRANTEALAMEQTIKLLESPQPVVVPWSEYPAFDQFGGFGGSDRPYYWSSLEDRQEGRYRPVYETEQDLRRIRASGRRLKNLFPVVAGALSSLTNYTIKGFEVKVQAKNPLFAEHPQVMQMIGAVQAVVDRFLEYNEFANNLDREIHDVSREEGEAFIALYPDGNLRNPEEAQVRVDLIDPDYILEPEDERPLNKMLNQGHKLNFWWHGVHTQFNPYLKRDDIRKPLGYHAVFDGAGYQWDYLPYTRIEHIKRNVGRTGRRGISDLYVVLNDIEAEAKIRRNTAAGAAILAAIVMIREHAEGTTQASVDRMVTGSATSSPSRYTQSGLRTVSNETIQPGTIKDTPAGMVSRVGPLGELNSPVYIEVAQYMLRTIHHRWCMPEYMTGDASNANLASTLVAESPFVRAREADQMFYGSHFENVIWKAICMYAAFGRIQYSIKDLAKYLSIKVSLASPANRDLKAHAEAYEVMHRNDVVSTETWMTDAGLDPDEEKRKIAEQPAKPAPVVAGPFGNSGGFGKPPGQPGMKKLEALAAGALKRLTEGAI